MDPTEGASEAGRFETFDVNRWFVVVRDESGYGVWRLDDLEEGDPIARFSDDDDGYEAAAIAWRELTAAERRRSSPWLAVLRITALVMLGLWTLSSVLSIAIFSFGEGAPFPGDPSAEGWEQTIAFVNAVSFDAWIAAAIAYLIVWMEERRRAGPVSPASPSG